MKRQRRLDQPRHTSGRHRMADHGFHRAQRAARRLGLARRKHPPQRFHFHYVAHRSTRTVRLHQAHGQRIYPRRLVGPAQCQFLPFQARRQHMRGPAVAGNADVLQYCINMVTVALGFRQAFQHHHAHALAQQRAIGVFVERAQLAAMRQRAQLRKDHHQDRRGITIHAARQSQIAGAVLELARRHFDRHQRTGASRVDQIIRPHQVQPVSDTACDDIGYQPGRSIRIELRQRGLDLLLDFGQFRIRVFGMQLLQNPQDALNHHALLQSGRVTPVDVSSAADDHRRALLDRFQIQLAAILQRVVRRLQGHVVIRFAAIHRVGHDAEAEGIELRQFAQESAALAVGAVVGLGILFVEELSFPLRRCVRDGVDLVQYIFPIASDVRRARQHTCHPNDGDVGDVVGSVVVHFTRFDLLIVCDPNQSAQIGRGKFVAE